MSGKKKKKNIEWLKCKWSSVSGSLCMLYYCEMMYSVDHTIAM